MPARGIVLRVTAVAALAAVNGARAEQIPQRPQPSTLTAQENSVVDRISADSLRGHVSFLASDLLEGRGTPSRGLDLAAEYIAAQYRRAGLEPVGDDSYFQTAHWREARFVPEGFSASLFTGEGDLPLKLEQTSLRYAEQPIDLKSAAWSRSTRSTAKLTAAIPAGDLKGKVFLVEQPDFQRVESSQRNQVVGGYFRLLDRLATEHAALVLNLDRKSKTGWGLDLGRLIDPEQGNLAGRPRRGSGVRIPVLTLHDPKAIKRLDALPVGETKAKFSLTLAAPVEKPANLRNVIGVLRGSDPKLRETYVLVTAHYDHLGKWPDLEGDQVFNGANDDASGTASVIELAGGVRRSRRPTPAQPGVPDILRRGIGSSGIALLRASPRGSPRQIRGRPQPRASRSYR